MITFRDYANQQRKRILDNFKQRDTFMMSISNTKGKICYYLIDHISVNTNNYDFSILKLANKFNCSKETVRRAIKLLQRNNYLKVTNHSIGYRNKHLDKLIKKGRDYHD